MEVSSEEFCDEVSSDTDEHRRGDQEVSNPQIL
jgi:hypothetical protein